MLGDISTYLYNISTGTAFTRIEPPISVIEMVAPYLINSTDMQEPVDAGEKVSDVQGVAIDSPKYRTYP